MTFDPRKLNNGEPCSTEFDVFWTKLAAHLEEHKHVDDRKQGQNKLPFNISIRAMVDNVVKAKEEEHGDMDEAVISVPSHAWVELQFCPKSVLATRTWAFTGQFIWTFFQF
eukprot:jgi/Tetstr1/442381/TSEL_030507.t1